jgi:hypothetical protein
MTILVDFLPPDLQPVYFGPKLKEGNYGSKLKKLIFHAKNKVRINVLLLLLVVINCTVAVVVVSSAAAVVDNVKRIVFYIYQRIPPCA